MSNRKKIEKFCKENDLEIVHLGFEKNQDHAYGDSWDASYWILDIKINNKVENYCSDGGDNVADGIKMMFKNIKEDIDNL